MFPKSVFFEVGLVISKGKINFPSTVSTVFSISSVLKNGLLATIETIIVGVLVQITLSTPSTITSV